MTQTRWSPTPPPVVSQNFDKIDSFLKPVLNICILGNLIVGWGGEYVNIWGRTYQKESWCSLRPSNTSKVDFFAEIVFGCKPGALFVHGYNLDVWLVPLDASKKHFLCFFRDDFASWKKHVTSKSVCLTFILQKKCDWLTEGWVSRKGVAIKRFK